VNLDALECSAAFGGNNGKASIGVKPDRARDDACARVATSGKRPLKAAGRWNAIDARAPASIGRGGGKTFLAYRDSPAGDMAPNYQYRSVYWFPLDGEFGRQNQEKRSAAKKG
jgi:hypothetical protein